MMESHGTATIDRGDWMQTATGRKFYPFDPRPAEIFIADIAHALSNICRYGGHTTNFYSVAEHCVHLARSVPAPDRLWALLHDASEAYIADVIRPIKPHLSGYSDLETKVMRAVCDRFGLPYEMPDSVKLADYAILTDECDQAMTMPPERWSTRTTGLGVKLHFWSPATARFRFLATFQALTADIPGISDEERLAIASGTEDCMHRVVCPDCAGNGKLWTGNREVGPNHVRTGPMVDCFTCDGRGHVVGVPGALALGGSR